MIPLAHTMKLNATIELGLSKLNFTNIHPFSNEQFTIQKTINRS